MSSKIFGSGIKRFFFLFFIFQFFSGNVYYFYNKKENSFNLPSLVIKVFMDFLAIEIMIYEKGRMCFM